MKLHMYLCCYIPTVLCRDCVQGVSEESPVSRFLLPSGDVVQTVLQYIWSLWEDPIDVNASWVHGV